MNEQHYVADMHLSLEFALGDQSVLDESGLGEFASRRMLGAADEVFTQSNTSDGVLRIDELKIDLGDVPFAGYRDSLPRLLKERLSQLLLDYQQPQLNGVRRLAQTEYDSDMLFHYLRTGQLPWYLARRSRIRAMEVMTGVLEAQPDILKSLLSQKDAELMLWRLLSQFGDVAAGVLTTAARRYDVLSEFDDMRAALSIGHSGRDSKASTLAAALTTFVRALGRTTAATQQGVGGFTPERDVASGLDELRMQLLWLSRAGASGADLWARLRDTQPEELASVLHELGGLSRFRRALVINFSDEMLDDIVCLIEPREQGYLYAVIHGETRKRGTEADTHIAEQAVDELVWEFTLAYLFVERGSRFNKRSYLSGLLVEMAAFRGVDVKEVIASMRSRIMSRRDLSALDAEVLATLGEIAGATGRDAGLQGNAPTVDTRDYLWFEDIERAFYREGAERWTDIEAKCERIAWTSPWLLQCLMTDLERRIALLGPTVVQAPASIIKAVTQAYIKTRQHRDDGLVAVIERALLPDGEQRVSQSRTESRLPHAEHTIEVGSHFNGVSALPINSEHITHLRMLVRHDPMRLKKLLDELLSGRHERQAFIDKLPPDLGKKVSSLYEGKPSPHQAASGASARLDEVAGGIDLTAFPLSSERIAQLQNLAHHAPKTLRQLLDKQLGGRHERQAFIASLPPEIGEAIVALDGGASLPLPTGGCVTSRIDEEAAEALLAGADASRASVAELKMTLYRLRRLLECTPGELRRWLERAPRRSELFMALLELLPDSERWRALGMMNSGAAPAYSRKARARVDGEHAKEGGVVAARASLLSRGVPKKWSAVAAGFFDSLLHCASGNPPKAGESERRLDALVAAGPAVIKAVIRSLDGEMELRELLVNFSTESTHAKVVAAVSGASSSALLRTAELITAAMPDAFTGLSSAELARAKWGYIYAYLASTGGRFNEAEFIRAYLEYLSPMVSTVRSGDELVERLGGGLERIASASTVTAVKRIRSILSSTQERRSASAASDESVVDESPADGDDESPGEDGIVESLYVENAGMVLLAPYIQRLLEQLGLTREREFVDRQAAEYAVHLLQYIVTAEYQTPEYQLVLNKLLCGVKPGRPIRFGIDPDTVDTPLIEGLLQAVIAHWTALGGTSIAGLRESFLQRSGRLYLKDDAWRLEVEGKAFDMLLDSIPWSFSTIKYPWMDRVIHVEWR